MGNEESAQVIRESTSDKPPLPPRIHHVSAGEPSTAPAKTVAVSSRRVHRHVSKVKQNTK